MKTFRFTTVADREMMDAAIYLEVRRRNFGRMFLNRIYRTIDLLLQFPHSGAPVEGTRQRKVNIRGFSYRLVYIPHGDCLWIVGVIHHSQNHDEWRHRGVPEDSE